MATPEPNTKASGTSAHVHKAVLTIMSGERESSDLLTETNFGCPFKTCYVFGWWLELSAPWRYRYLCLQGQHHFVPSWTWNESNCQALACFSYTSHGNCPTDIYTFFMNLLRSSRGLIVSWLMRPLGRCSTNIRSRILERPETLFFLRGISDHSCYFIVRC